jgi:regulator of nucleoside diphosphate kinase
MQNHQNERASRPRIVIAASQHEQLLNLADRARGRDPHVAEFLTDELTRAFVVPDGSCAANVVQIGSCVTYREDSTARVRRVVLTYPHDANIDQNRISILTPIGAALIGMSIAQTIEWPTPHGAVASLTVLDVTNETDTAQASA